MIQSQWFEIQKQGLVRGGQASYQADLATGQLTYQVSLKVGFGFTKTYRFTGSYYVAASVLKSSTLDTVGKMGTIRPLSFKVTEKGESYARVNLSLHEFPLSGKATFDLRQPYLRLTYLSAEGQVSGVNGQITLTEAPRGAAQISYVDAFIIGIIVKIQSWLGVLR